MKIDDKVVVNKQQGIIAGMPGDLYYNPTLNRNMKVPHNMICVETSTAVLVFPISQVKLMNWCSALHKYSCPFYGVFELYQPEIKSIYNRLKASAKKRNIPFTITAWDLCNLSFPITCPILGLQLKYNRGAQQDNSYSIDRIDSTLGYDVDNIIVISWRANRLKSNSTTEELNKISEFYTNLHNKE